MAASAAGKGGGAAMPLAGIYELSGRPNISKAGDLSQATWDSATCKALVERPKKQLAVMGHWVSGWGVAVSEGGAQRKMLALFPEEMLLLVEQGLLLLRLPESTRVLSVVEAQALALSSAHVCPLYFEAYAHARDLGLVALRLEILPSLKCAIKPAFRGRPMLALWSAERGYCKGWRQSSPDHILVTSRACESLPSRSEWEQIDELASLAGATVKMAVVDGTGCPVMFDCCSGRANVDGGVSLSSVVSQDVQAVHGISLPDRHANEEEVRAQIQMQGNKVRQLKADPNLPQDTASQLALVSEIYELKRLKALLPCEAPCKEDTHTIKRRKT